MFIAWCITTFVPFQFIVHVTDQATPEKTATASLTVDVQRDQFQPTFVYLPYLTGTDITVQTGTVIYQRVEALDQDLLVSAKHNLFTDCFQPYTFVDKSLGFLLFNDNKVAFVH